MKVLLTGAFGSLGSLVIGELLDQRHSVLAFDVPTKTTKKVARAFDADPNVEIVWGDIRDASQVAALVRRVDAVLHLAALIPPFSETDPERAYAVNVGGTKNILRAIQHADRPPLMVFSSSISVFGPRGKGAPLCTPDDDIAPTDHYSGHKIECERK